MGKLIQRPPIVTVLGHVDHGKTTLLDALRKTNIASREAGGITQKIGASVVETKEGKKITFIDTPGHAAFSAMRGRGAKVADIAILVVAADDGVAPQTKEAIKIITDAKIPFIVALTKVDLATANAESVVSQLEKEGIFFEGRGGQIPKVEVSAKTGKGIDELIDLIDLMSEVSDIKGDTEASLEAVVIETSKGKAGNLVSLVVRNGTLKVGDQLSAEKAVCKVRGIFDDNAKLVKEVLPGYPAQVLGFESLPPVGSKVVYSIEQGKFEAEFDQKVGAVKIKEGQLPIIIKADNAGSLEAIIGSLLPEAVVVSSGVGEVTENDVFLAKSSGAAIYAFETKSPASVVKLAETEGVKIKTFRVIYELFKDIDDIVKGGKKEIVGRAQIVATFPFNNKKIAGCKMISGKFTKTDQLILTKNEKEFGKVKILSLKKQKEEVAEVKEGEEFGVLFVPQLDFAIGDMLISVAK